MKDHLLYLEDILLAMEMIEAFVQGMSFEAFRADIKTSDAVVRRFEIIGEASKHVPAEIREKCPDVPWSEMARMRDRLIHAYNMVDYELVWRTIKQRIPAVKQHLRRILDEHR